MGDSRKAYYNDYKECRHCEGDITYSIEHLCSRNPSASFKRLSDSDKKMLSSVSGKESAKIKLTETEKQIEKTREKIREMERSCDALRYYIHSGNRQ